MLVVNTINKFFKEFTWKWYLVRRGEKHSCSWSPTRPTWRQMQTSNNLATWNTHYFFIVLQSEWQCLVFITLFKETEVQSKKREMLSPWINVVQIRHRKKKHIMNNTEKLYLHNERQWKAKHPSGRQFQTAASRALIDITFRHSISSDTTKKMITCNYCALWRTGTFPSLQVRLALYRTMINRLSDQRS